MPKKKLNLSTATAKQVAAHAKKTEHIIASTMFINEKNINTIFDQAKQLVYGERNKNYGHPSDNFDNIRTLWNAYLKGKGRYQGQDISLVDVAMLNILQKIARISTNPTHRDSLLDIAGYAGTVERIQDNK